MLLGIHIIKDKKQRDIWYLSQTKKSRPGAYAYGAKELKCIKTPKGYRIKNIYLHKDTPIYKHGYATSTPLKYPRGAFAFKIQLPHVELPNSISIEEEIFSLKNDILTRSQNTKLKIRCGKYYRIVLLNLKVTDPYCYIFGTNIKVKSEDIPAWMRRRNIVIPNTMKTSKKVVKSRDGVHYPMGKPKVGKVYIAGIEMHCSKINNLCTIRYCGKKFYAHASVTFNYKQYHNLNNEELLCFQTCRQRHTGSS